MKRRLAYLLAAAITMTSLTGPSAVYGAEAVQQEATETEEAAADGSAEAAVKAEAASEETTAAVETAAPQETQAEVQPAQETQAEPEARQVRKALNRIGEELFPLFLEVQRADCLAQSAYMRAEKLERIARVEKCAEEIRAAGDCLSLKTLAVNGSDLKRAGFSEGKEMGMLLSELLQHVLEHPEDNDKEKLLSIAAQRRFCLDTE
jgi:hypothetical protein